MSFITMLNIGLNLVNSYASRMLDILRQDLLTLALTFLAIYLAERNFRQDIYIGPISLCVRPSVCPCVHHKSL